MFNDDTTTISSLYGLAGVAGSFKNQKDWQIFAKNFSTYLKHHRRWEWRVLRGIRRNNLQEQRSRYFAYWRRLFCFFSTRRIKSYWPLERSFIQEELFWDASGAQFGFYSQKSHKISQIFSIFSDISEHWTKKVSWLVLWLNETIKKESLYIVLAKIRKEIEQLTANRKIYVINKAWHRTGKNHLSVNSLAAENRKFNFTHKAPRSNCTRESDF